MGLFDRVEGRLSNAVMGAFARTFKSAVQPVEIASGIRSAMDDKAAVGGGRARTFVPNVFTVELSPSDYDRLLDYGDDLEDELVAAAEEHADSQGYRPGGPIEILFREDDSIETGVFKIRSSTAKRPRATGQTGQQRPVEARREEWDDDEGYAVRSPQPPASPPSARRSAAAAGPAAPPGAGAGAAVGTGAAPPGVTARQPAAGPDERPRRRVNPADRPWLEIDGERYPLMGAITVLGRDDTADIILDDPGISRRHSEIRVTQDGPHVVATVRDMGSTNGTFVNGERITSAHLSPDDRITVGRTSATYRAGRR